MFFGQGLTLPGCDPLVRDGVPRPADAPACSVQIAVPVMLWFEAFRRAPAVEIRIARPDGVRQERMARPAVNDVPTLDWLSVPATRMASMR